MAGSLAYEARTPEEAAACVEKIAAEKPDLIKLMITGGVMDAEVVGEPGVLRMQPGQQLELFNGDGNQYAATITAVGKKSVDVHIDSCEARSVESPFAIHLGQVISRGDKMDFTIQKSVELGVTCITPLFSERCGVKLPAGRLEKKREQWQKVVISACEQCGRNVVPEVRMPIELDAWLAEETQ